MAISGDRQLMAGETEKKKYGWKEVVQLTGVSKSTLVRWENADHIPKPKRRASNRARLFDEDYIRRAKEFKEREIPPPSPPKHPKGK